MVIEPAACFLWAFLLLILPLDWLLCAFCAALFHELWHYAALVYYGANPDRLYIGATGMKLEIPELAYKQELVCALAGPVGSLLLLLAYRWWPYLSLCALIQGIFNLLPIYPLDGGRALRCFTRILLPEKHADWICAAAETLSVAGIFLLGWYWKWTALLFFAAFFLILKVLSGKRPCKPSQLRVQ